MFFGNPLSLTLDSWGRILLLYGSIQCFSPRAVVPCSLEVKGKAGHGHGCGGNSRESGMEPGKGHCRGMA